MRTDTSPTRGRDSRPATHLRPAWRWAVTLGLFLAMLGVWSGIVHGYRLPPLVLPLPSAVLTTLWQLLVDGTLWPHLGVTLSEILLGFLIGSGLGLGLGSLVALSPAAQYALGPYIIASQAMPKLALAPLFVIWFGFGIVPKALIAALIAFFPLFENTLAGLRDVDDEALDLFRMLAANRWHLFLKLRLPNAIPYLFAGLRVAIVLSVVGTVVGEYIGASKGLGALIIASQGQMDTPLMFAIFVLLTLLGMALYQLVHACERWVLRRRSRIRPMPGYLDVSRKR
jgi:NitT/TauT family transport system permease protein